MADKDSMEIISALVDGELTDRDMHDAIRATRSNHRQCCSWERYHLIGDSLRNNLPASIDRQFLNRISAALVSEPPLNAPPSLPLQSRKAVSIKPVAGFALAASVALTAFVGVGMFSVDEGGQPLPPVAVAPASNAPAVAPLPQSPVVTVADGDAPLDSRRWNVSQPDVESKLNIYLSNHQSVSVTARVNGAMLPHVRLVNETYPSTGQ